MRALTRTVGMPRRPASAKQVRPQLGFGEADEVRPPMVEEAPRRATGRSSGTYWCSAPGGSRPASTRADVTVPVVSSTAQAARHELLDQAAAALCPRRRWRRAATTSGPAGRGWPGMAEAFAHARGVLLAARACASAERPARQARQAACRPVGSRARRFASSACVARIRRPDRGRRPCRRRGREHRRARVRRPRARFRALRRPRRVARGSARPAPWRRGRTACRGWPGPRTGNRRGGWSPRRADRSAGRTGAPA